MRWTTTLQNFTMSSICSTKKAIHTSALNAAELAALDIPLALAGDAVASDTSNNPPQPAPKRAGFFVPILLPKENVADCLAVHRIRDIHDSISEKLRQCLCINNVAMS